LPLYNSGKREAIRISNYVLVQPVSCPPDVSFDGMKEPVLVLLDLRGGGAPPLRLTAPGTGGFDQGAGNVLIKRIIFLNAHDIEADVPC